ASTPACPSTSRSRSGAPGPGATRTGPARLKHLHLELGGKNAIIVLDDANLDLAVDGIIWSAFGTSGQRCTAASRVIAHEAVYDELVSRLVGEAEEMRVGYGLGEGEGVGPGHKQAAPQKGHV